MSGIIKLTNLNIDDEDFHFEIILSNSVCSTRLDFYGDVDTFKNFGAQLTEFPQHINDVVIFELGKNSEDWAYYMVIKAFCYDASGHTAIRMVVDNHGDIITRHRSEFSIVTEAASINALGALLKDWDVKTTKEITWQSQTS